MTDLFLYKVISIFLSTLYLTGAFPQSGFDFRGSREQRNMRCQADLQYLDGNICCLNCPAGTHVKAPCTTARELGTCEECEDGKYTEHANGLRQCLKCTQCRSDQEVVRQCTTTQDTECQCKQGWFCAPDEACEVCKKCSKCEKHEVKVRNCTSTTNTECKKSPPNPDSASDNTAVIVTVLVVVAAAVVLIAVVTVILWRRRRSAAGSSRNPLDALKAGQGPSGERRNGETQRPSCTSWPLVRAKSSGVEEDERQVLCESLNSSASNSQHSLTGLPCPSAFPVPPLQACLVVPVQPNMREDEQFLKLTPVNGEDSLRQCFGYFEEMDVDYHKRFFRHLGITDNVIKSKEHLQYEDKIHELLNIWMEKQGRDASLNDLLTTLLDLNQRRTAETVKENAIQNGHYTHEG